MKRIGILAFTVLCFTTVSCLGIGGVKKVTRPDTVPTNRIETVNNAVEPLIPQREAELRYFQVLEDVHNGYVDRAINELQYLISKRVNDRYVYLTLLSLFTNKLQNPGTSMSEKEADRILSTAQKYSEEAIRNYPEFMPILYVSTEIARLGNHFDRFLKILDLVLTNDDKDIYANYYLGAYYYLNKDKKKAIPYLQTVVTYSTRSSQFEAIAQYNASKYLGLIAAEESRYDEAIRYMEKAREIYDRDYDVAKILALLNAEVLRFRESANYFRNIPELYLGRDNIDTYAGVLFALRDADLDRVVRDFSSYTSYIHAITNFLAGKYDSSLKDLEQSAKDKKSTDYYHHYLLYENYRMLTNRDKEIQEAFLLGKKARDVSQSELAIEFFKIVEGSSKAIPDIYWLIGSLYDDVGDYTNATVYYEKYVSSPGNKDNYISALVRMSFMYSKLDSGDKSAENIQTAKKEAKSRQDIFQTYFYSGLMNYDYKKYQEAVDDFKRALQASPLNVRVYYFIGSILVQLQKNKEAIEYLVNARKINPDSPEINNLLAYVYALEGVQLDEALGLVRLALVMQPDNVAYKDTLGWVYFRKGDMDKATEIFRSIEIRIPLMEDTTGLDEIYYHIGMLYETMEDREKAREYYLKGKKINPDNPYIQEKFRSSKP